MKWSFRSKLMTAFLLFGLVPTLIMTFVTFAGDRAAQGPGRRALVYRSAMFAAEAMSRSPLDGGRARSRPVLDRTNVGPIEDMFDDVLKEYTVLDLRLALVAPDMAGRRDPVAGPTVQSPFAAGEKIDRSLRRVSVTEPGRSTEGKPISYVETTATSGPEIVGLSHGHLRGEGGGKPADFAVIVAIARQSDAYGPINTIRYLNYRRARRAAWWPRSLVGALALGPVRPAPARGRRGHAPAGARPPRRPVVDVASHRRVRRALDPGQLPDRAARRRDHRDRPGHRLGLLGQHGAERQRPAALAGGDRAGQHARRRSPRAWRRWTPR